MNAEVRRRLGHLGSVVMLGFALAAPVHATPAAEPTGSLHFLDGAVLHGALNSIDTNSGVRWHHPDAPRPFSLPSSRLDCIQFDQSLEMSNAPACLFRFAGGDDLYGSLISLDSNNMSFDTWFGSTLKIPRAAIQTISFLPRNYSLIYEGPSEGAGWTVAGSGMITTLINGQAMMINGGLNLNGNVVVLGGNFRSGAAGNNRPESAPVTKVQSLKQSPDRQAVNIGGMQYLVSSQNPTTCWVLRDGEFDSLTQGTLSREFHLTRSCTLEFDLTTSPNFMMVVDLYGVADQLDLNNSVAVGLVSDPNYRRMRSQYQPGDLGGVVVPKPAQPGPTHITIHCNKDANSVVLLADGVELQRWNDVSISSGMGGAIVFENQLGGATLSISHIKVSEWDGAEPPDTFPPSQAGSDFVSFRNQDRAAGVIAGIADGKLDFTIGGRTLHLPAERVRTLSFAQPTASAEPRGPWEVRAVFPGGGSVSFQLEKWDASTVSGRSALFGALIFPVNSIRELYFNLDHPVETPTAEVENQFDVLDQ